MKKNLYYFSLLIVLGLVIQSCAKKEDAITTLRIVRINAPDDIQSQDSVKVSYTPVMELDYILLSRLDTTGVANDTLQLQEPVYAYMQVGKNYTSVFMRPGDDLTVIIDQRDKNHVIVSYKSIHVGNNIGELNSYFSKTLGYFSDSNNKFIRRDAESFTAALDSLSAAIANHYKAFSDTVSLTEKETDLINTFNNIQHHYSQLWYLFRTHNDFLVGQIDAFRAGKEVHDYITPLPLRKILSEVPMDTILLRSHAHGIFYKQLLYFYSREKFFYPFFDVTLWDKPNPLQPNLDYEVVKAQSYPTPIKEFFLANNLKNDLQDFGITEVLDSVFTKFAKDYPHSEYLGTLQKVYDQQVAILPGSVAPNITGKKVDGTVVNLTDFKGRIVYVDVWATWCGPCLEEIPESVKLQDSFKNNKDIIFLNVSVDKDVQAWKNKVAKEENWKGVHINLTEEEKERLTKNYRIAGYPKYFLIDKNGNIVTNKAPRPSSKDVLRNKLIELLNSEAAI